MTTKVVAIVVLGREFFDRRNGVSYQSAEIIKIYDDGAKETLIECAENGYDAAYLNRACDRVFGKTEGGIMWRACAKHKIALVTNLETVTAFKRLHCCEGSKR